MKKISTFLFLSSLFLFANAQKSDVVFFSEEGLKFRVFITGSLQNQAFESQVKVTDLSQEFINVRFEFEGGKEQPITSNVALASGKEVVYMLKRSNKGKLVCRYYSEADKGIDHTYDSAPVVVFNPTGNTTTTPSVNVQADDGQETLTTTTTVKTTVNQPIKSKENVNINMSVPGVNVNMTMPNINMEIEENQSTTVTTTKTTTTTTSRPQMNTTTTPPAQPAVVGDCATTMTATTFESAKKNITSQSFEESKLKVAKQVIKSNCMNVKQVKQVLAMFSFEESKLDFAKFAYRYTTDKPNYFELNSAFSFSSSVDELNEFLESQQ
jgi:hypothetical protein